MARPLKLKKIAKTKQKKILQEIAEGATNEAAYTALGVSRGTFYGYLARAESVLRRGRPWTDDERELLEFLESYREADRARSDARVESAWKTLENRQSEKTKRLSIEVVKEARPFPQADGSIVYREIVVRKKEKVQTLEPSPAIAMWTIDRAEKRGASGGKGGPGRDLGLDLALLHQAEAETETSLEEEIARLERDGLAYLEDLVQRRREQLEADDALDIAAADLDDEEGDL